MAAQAPPAGAAAAAGADIVLPNQAGQVWREYDITPYSRDVQGDRPQQAAIDWVLRETGADLWFGEPLGILSASPTKLRVYHTPEVQKAVGDVVRRLNGSRTQRHALHLRLCTITSPSWRAQAMRMLQPVAAQSPGVEAWLLSKDDAATLVGQLARRADYREHHSPNLDLQDGVPQTIAKTQPRTYVRTYQVQGLLGPEPVQGSIDEGFTLRLSPLMSLDGQNMDAVVQCQIDQVERLVSVPIDPLPGATGRLEIEVPQLVSWRLQERFRWPADQVLLLSCGVVAQPAPARNPLLKLPLPVLNAAPRGDALMFLEVTGIGRQGAAIRAAAAPAAAAGPKPRY